MFISILSSNNHVYQKQKLSDNAINLQKTDKQAMFTLKLKSKFTLILKLL